MVDAIVTLPHEQSCVVAPRESIAMLNFSAVSDTINGTQVDDLLCLVARHLGQIGRLVLKLRRKINKLILLGGIPAVEKHLLRQASVNVVHELNQQSSTLLKEDLGPALTFDVIVDAVVHIVILPSVEEGKTDQVCHVLANVT